MFWPRAGVEHLHPGPVQRRVLGVVAGLVDPPLPDLLGVEARRGVEDGDPVAHQLAVGDHRQLHRLDALEVDHALLVGRHQVGDRHHGHRVDGLEAAEAGAVGRVTDVVVGGELARRRRPATAEVDGSRRRTLHRAARRRLFEADELRLGVDDGDRVLLAPLGGQPVERLLGPAAPLDDELELVARVLTLGALDLADLHGDVVARGASLEGRHPVRAEVGVASGHQLGPGRRRS